MKKVLIVVDMQNDFVDGSLGSPEAVAIVPRAAEKIRAFDGDLLVTYDTHGGEDYLETQQGRLLPVAHCVKGTEGWELYPAIAEAVEAAKGRVIRYGKEGFASPDVAPLVREYGEIHLVGLCTDICVMSNALLLKSFYPEKPIYLDPACCAASSPEGQSAALTVMKACQILFE